MISIAKVFGMRKRILYCVLFYRLITFHYVFRLTADNLSESDRVNCIRDIGPCRAHIPLEQQTRALDLLARDLLSVPLADPYAPDLALACLLFPRTVPYGPEGYGAEWECASCDHLHKGCPPGRGRGPRWDEVCAFYCGPRPPPGRPTATPRTDSTATPSNAQPSTTATTPRTLARRKKYSVVETASAPSVTRCPSTRPPGVRNVSNSASPKNNLTFKSDETLVSPIATDRTLQSRATTIAQDEEISFTQSLLWKRLVPWIASATVIAAFLCFFLSVGCCCSGKTRSRAVVESNALLQRSLEHECRSEVESANTPDTNRHECIELTPSESVANSTGTLKALKWKHNEEKDSFVTESSLSDATSGEPSRKLCKRAL